MSKTSCLLARLVPSSPAVVSAPTGAAPSPPPPAMPSGGVEERENVPVRSRGMRKTEAKDEVEIIDRRPSKRSKEPLAPTWFDFAPPPHRPRALEI